MTQTTRLRTPRIGAAPAPAGQVRGGPQRREQVLEAAAVAFGRGGYHAVGLTDIASAVGLSAPALYRHFPTKYALFAEVAHREMQSLDEAARAAYGGVGRDVVGDPDASLELSTVLTAIAECTVAHRAHGSLYRWEARFLSDPDRAVLRASTRSLRATVVEPLRRRRPTLTDREATLLASAALAVVASATVHHLVGPWLPARLAELALAVLDTALPPAAEGTDLPAQPPAWQVGLRPSSMRSQLVTEATKAFERHGYHSATLEEIGGAVGLTASGVYRYFPTKAALLTAGFTRSDIQLAAVTEAALSEAATADEALGALAAAYVRLWFQRPEVMSVYASERAHVPADDRDELRQVQRDHVDAWVRVVRAVVPGLDEVHARLRVHAALTIVVDCGRLLRFDRRPETRRRIEALVLSVLTAPSSATPTDESPSPT